MQPPQCGISPINKLDKLSRPKSLNAFGGKLLQETINAVRELNEDPDTVFTVLTGAGRFFSAGADIMSMRSRPVLEFY